MYRLNDKIKDLKPYDPVGERYRIHLDANESFLPIPAEVLEEVKADLDKLEFNRYPDPLAKEACEAFSGYYGVPVRNVVAGNGSDELITVIFTAFLQKGDAFATLEPDFSMYAFNGFLQEMRHVVIGKKEDFTLDIDRVIETCNNEGVKLLIFSNPCNPTSVVQSREEMRKLIRGVDALVILDEAYMDFGAESLLKEFMDYDNLILLRTCSKAFGMAALRLGFAVANDMLAGALRAVKSPYNVNSVTQKIGAAVLRRKEELQKALAEILNSRNFLLEQIKQIGGEFPNCFTVFGGSTNFVTLVLEEPERLYQYLGEQGISVRFTSGLIRVTCGTEEENREVLQVLRNYLKEKGE